MKNGFYTIYMPVVQPIEGDCFEVNGANSIYEERAISKAKKHVSFKNGAKILRVDKCKEYIEWNYNNSFLKD